MDFIICESKLSERLEQRYDCVSKVNGLWVGYAETGNLSTIKWKGTLQAIISGSLFGPLADQENLRGSDAARLGEHALASDGSFAVAVLRDGHVNIITDAGGSTFRCITVTAQRALASGRWSTTLLPPPV